MNVLIIMPELIHGGAEKQMRLLARGLKVKGHEVAILLSNLHGGAPKLTEDSRYLKLLEEGISISEVNGAPVLGVVGRRLRARRITEVAKHVIEEKHIEICLIYDFVSLHSAPALSELTRVVFSERNEGSYSIWAFFRNRRLFRCLSALTCNSEEARRNYSMRGYNIKYIPNGIDVKHLPPAIRKNPCRILVPARICPVKNQMLVVRAVEMMCDRDDYSFVFAGAIEDDQYYHLLIEEIESKGLSTYFSFAGQIADMSGAYQDCNAVLLPSLSEGTSNVILESMECGRFVIASDIEQNRCLLSDSELFDPQSPQALVSRLDYVSSLDEMSENKILKRNRALVEEGYSVGTMVKSYERLFDSIVAKRG